MTLSLLISDPFFIIIIFIYRRSYRDVVKPMFEKHLIEDQNLFSPPHSTNILSLLPPELSSALSESWEKDGSLTGREKWAQLKASVKKYNVDKNKVKREGEDGGVVVLF